MEGAKYEFRHALTYLFNLFDLFRAQYIELGGNKNKSIKLMDKIYEQIVYIKLVQLVDEEHTLEEEVDKLKEALCILLKFFENNEETAIVTIEKVSSINYEQAMQCTAEEFEATLLRLFHKILGQINIIIKKIWLDFNWRSAFSFGGATIGDSKIFN